MPATVVISVCRLQTRDPTSFYLSQYFKLNRQEANECKNLISYCDEKYKIKV